MSTGNGLVITTKVEPITGGPYGPSNYNYTSGAVQWSSANFVYGTVEIRAKLPGGTTWPTLWFLGANCQQVLKTQTINTGACQRDQPGSDEIDMVDVSLDWHTYSIVWMPGSLVWKIDGTTTCTVTTAVPTTPMFLIIDTALGGEVGGTVKVTQP